MVDMASETVEIKSDEFNTDVIAAFNCLTDDHFELLGDLNMVVIAECTVRISEMMGRCCS